MPAYPRRAEQHRTHAALGGRLVGLRAQCCEHSLSPRGLYLPALPGLGERTHDLGSISGSSVTASKQRRTHSLESSMSLGSDLRVELARIRRGLLDDTVCCRNKGEGSARSRASRTSLGACSGSCRARIRGLRALDGRFLVIQRQLVLGQLRSIRSVVLIPLARPMLWVIPGAAVGQGRVRRQTVGGTAASRTAGLNS
jgi:hypothetical protein